MINHINAGIQLSLDGSTWYALTDNNRGPIVVNNSLIEQSQRMANGKLRKYVIASKKTFQADWKNLTSSSTDTVDGNYSSAWLSAFYEANVFVPIYLKFTHSKETTPTTGTVPDDSTFQNSQGGYDVYKVFITKFDVTTTHRNRIRDFVDMTIEFTEI